MASDEYTESRNPYPDHVEVEYFNPDNGQYETVVVAPEGAHPWPGKVAFHDKSHMLLSRAQAYRHGKRVLESLQSWAPYPKVLCDP